MFLGYQCHGCNHVVERCSREKHAAPNCPTLVLHAPAYLNTVTLQYHVCLHATRLPTMRVMD